MPSPANPPVISETWGYTSARVGSPKMRPSPLGLEMHRSFINLQEDRSKGIDALKAGGITAVFSDAVRVDLQECALLFISGRIGTDASGAVADRTMRGQTRQVLEGIKGVLERESGTMDDVVRVRVYVTQLDAPSLREIHEVRSEYFRAGHYPASTLVRVDQLVRDGALIEIDADAVIARGPSERPVGA